MLGRMLPRILFYDVILHTRKYTGWGFTIWILESTIQVSSFAYALRRNFRGVIPHDTVRFLRLFQHVVKQNRTFTRRKRIIPPTFPPYKDAWRGHNGAVPSYTLALHLFHGKTSFLLLSIDAYARRQVMKALLSPFACFMTQTYNAFLSADKIYQVPLLNTQFYNYFFQKK